MTAQVLEHEERRAALDEWLVAMEDEHGPIPSEAMEEARRAWPPTELGMPELVPDLAPELDSLSELLAADRDEQRGR